MWNPLQEHNLIAMVLLVLAKKLRMHSETCCFHNGTNVYSVVVFYFDYTVSYMYRGLTVHCNSSSINKLSTCARAQEAAHVIRKISQKYLLLTALV